MHWAAHGHTAAEVIYKRISAEKPFLGLTNFEGIQPNKSEISIAKNYLNEQELNVLNRIVTAYLEFAELQALSRKPMYMRDWIDRLDDFIKMTGNSILDNAGSISHQQMLDKAQTEYDLYKEKTKDQLSRAEENFIRQIEQTAQQLEDSKKKKKD